MLVAWNLRKESSHLILTCTCKIVNQERTAITNCRKLLIFLQPSGTVLLCKI